MAKQCSCICTWVDNDRGHQSYFPQMLLVLRWLGLYLGVPLTCFASIQLDFNSMEILNYKFNRDFVFPFIFNHSDKQITLMNGFTSTHSRIMVWFITLKFTLCWAHLFHSMFATTCNSCTLRFSRFLDISSRLLSCYDCLWPFHALFCRPPVWHPSFEL